MNDEKPDTTPDIEAVDAAQPPAVEPSPAPAPPAPVAPRDPGRPERMGLPPDGDEEQHVLTVRPAIIKAYPARTVLLLAWPFVFFILMWTLSNVDVWSNWFLITSGVLLLVSWGFLLVWWVRFRWTCSLYITNKRTIERRGLLSRSSDEVLHDHVRNVNIEQSFFERVFNVGSVGISSAGQADTEIQVQKIPRPDYVKEIIDAYRDDLGRRERTVPVD